MAETYNSGDSLKMGNGRTAAFYRAKEVQYPLVLQSGETHLLENFQDGDMITFSKDEAKFTGISDPQGNVGLSENDNSLGTGTAHMMYGSPSFKLLLNLYNTGETFSLHKNDGTEYVGGDHCVIKQPPEVADGKDFPTRTFTITVLDYEHKTLDE